MVVILSIQRKIYGHSTPNYTTKMEALRPSILSSLHIHIQRTEAPPILHSWLTSIRSSVKYPLTIHQKQHTCKSKLFSSLTPQSTPISTQPLTEPVIESEEEDEKFDWFKQWYPIMAVGDLDKRRPHGKRVMGIDVVVWWDRNENCWKVFDDTCPHRLAPLSEGRIDQWGRLQCVYHGWCFNGSGSCQFIPQSPPDGPPVHTFKKACIAAYPSTVQNGILWFWPNSDPQYQEILSSKKPPFISELDDPSYTKSLTSREFPFGYEILIENLVDPAHVPYAHFKILPVPPSKSTKLDREGGAPIDINIEKLDIDGFVSSRQGANSKFLAPCVYYSAFSLPSKQRKSGNDGDKLISPAENSKERSSVESQRRGVLLFFCVPVSPGKSRLIISFPRNFGVWIDRIIPRWVFHLQQNLVLDSDLYLLHIEERKIMNAGASNWQKACFLPTKSDAQVVAFRRWLSKYSGSQINWEGKFDQALPPTPPKEQLMDRYWSHVVSCSSCSVAYKVFNALEVILQVASIGLLGIVAATKQGATGGAATRTALVLMAVFSFAASRWLTHFVYKNFHFHDYDHARL